MTYILVTLTIVLVISLAVAAALLGSERVFPARRVIEYVSTDGVDIVGEGEPVHVLSDAPTQQELRRVTFATSIGGYNKDEVDQFIQLLIDENTSLRKSGAADAGTSQESESVAVDD